MPRSHRIGLPITQEAVLGSEAEEFSIIEPVATSVEILGKVALGATEPSETYDAKYSDN